MMISAAARQGFDQLFMRALGSALVADGEPACEVRALGPAAVLAHDRVVVLTISSYGFRLLGFIHFTLDAATRVHLSTFGGDGAVLDDAAALDVIAERGNICCGALNRHLGPFFPHTGMSTPNLLDRRSIESIATLGAEHLRHFELRIAGGPTLHASLCVCANQPLDFTVSATQVAEAEEAVGELEMF